MKLIYDLFKTKKKDNIFEIYLTSKEVTKDTWLKFIQVVSKYIGYFKSYKIIIIHNLSEIRYYLVTNSELPTTIGNLEEFAIKKVNIDLNISSINSFIYFNDIFNTFADIIDKEEIKKRKKIKRIEIKIKSLSEERILSSSHIYFEEKNKILRRRLLITIPQKILSIDFYKNNKYFYKKCPKYLDISKTMHFLKSDSNNSLLKIDAFPYLQGDYYLNQGSYDFDKHSIAIGASGSGKSKFISLLVNNLASHSDYKMKYKVVVIDPHSSLEDDIGGIEDSKIINFKTLENSINLFENDNENIVSNVEMIISLMKTLINDYNSKLERVLRHSINLLLNCKRFNFKNLKMLLLNSEYRNIFIKEGSSYISNSTVDFFLTDFTELKTKSYNEAISPIITFIDEMELLPVFNDNKSSDQTFLSMLESNFLTIFSLDRIFIGDKVLKTISGLIMQQLMQLIQARKTNEHIILIIDEVSIIENPILINFLSEARKYNLSVIIAQQYFNQISEGLKHSIFANVLNYYVFRVSKSDAKLLVDNISMKIPKNETEEEKIEMLVNLNDRECIARISDGGLVYPALKGKTVDFNGIPKKENINIEKLELSKIKINEEKIKKKFDISSTINLTELLLNQSSSRINIRRE